MADPRALLVAVAAAHAVEHVGLPEARLNLAHATIYLATAPKSNSVTVALTKAFEDALSSEPVPMHLRDASYPGARQLGPRQGLPVPARLPRPSGGAGVPAGPVQRRALLRALRHGRRGGSGGPRYPPGTLRVSYAHHGPNTEDS